MRLSVAILLCVLVLCITGVLDSFCRTLHIRPVLLALGCIVLLCANVFRISCQSELHLNPAYILLMLLFGIIAAFNQPGGLLYLLPLSLLAGTLLYFGSEILLTNVNPGLLIGLCGAALGMFFHSRHSAFFFCALTPVCFSLCASLHDLISIGFTLWEVGTVYQFDAQIIAVVSYAAILFFTQRHRIKALN